MDCFCQILCAVIVYSLSEWIARAKKSFQPAPKSVRDFQWDLGFAEHPIDFVEHPTIRETGSFLPILVT